eukprot:12121465-Prorocentrum_lima.AAC.1
MVEASRMSFGPLPYTNSVLGLARACLTEEDSRCRSLAHRWALINLSTLLLGFVHGVRGPV